MPPKLDSVHSNPRIFWDTIFDIVDFVPTNHLTTLLLTCQTIRHHAEICLYRHINLVHCPTRSRLLFETLITSPYLASLVRSFETSENIRHSETGILARILHHLQPPGQSLEEASRQYHRMARAAVLRLVNVEAITFYGPHTHILSSLPHIKKLRYRQPLDILGLEIDLNSLPHLTSLDLPIYSIAAHLKKVILDAGHSPELQELVCPIIVAVNLVPGRPIKRLFVCSNFGTQTEYDMLSTMALSTEKITTFSLLAYYPIEQRAKELLKTISCSMPHIEELTLRLNLLNLSSKRSLDNFLSSLQSIRVLDMNGTGFRLGHSLDANRLGPSSIYLPRLERWKASCPKLSTVVFPNGTAWHYEGRAMSEASRAEWVCIPGDRVDLGIRQRVPSIPGAPDTWFPGMFAKDLERE